MLKLRPMTLDDIGVLRELHERYYEDRDFPDFFSNYLCRFVIIDDTDGSIITAGGVEPIGEAVLVTNKEKSRVAIGRALVEAQEICMYACRTRGISELHAFTPDEHWKKHLMLHGFSPRAQALSMMVPNVKR